jgi:hypothetical protein
MRMKMTRKTYFWELRGKMTLKILTLIQRYMPVYMS